MIQSGGQRENVKRRNEYIRIKYADGVKRLAQSEFQNYGRTNRSLHFMNDYAAGHVILPKDIGVLRTEKELSVGISPEFLDEIIGKTLAHEVKSGQGVRLDHFMN